MTVIMCWMLSGALWWVLLISSTQVRGYNTQFLLYPQALSE